LFLFYSIISAHKLSLFVNHSISDLRWSRGIPPGPDKVKVAHNSLKNPTKAQAKHPLFARGFETPLTLRVSDCFFRDAHQHQVSPQIFLKYLMVSKATEDGLIVSVSTDKGDIIVMNHPIYKVLIRQLPLHLGTPRVATNCTHILLAPFTNLISSTSLNHCADRVRTKHRFKCLLRLEAPVPH
jgi:hypothetical protein